MDYSKEITVYRIEYNGEGAIRLGHVDNVPEHRTPWDQIDRMHFDDDYNQIIDFDYDKYRACPKYFNKIFGIQFKKLEGVGWNTTIWHSFLNNTHGISDGFRYSWENENVMYMFLQGCKFSNPRSEYNIVSVTLRKESYFVFGDGQVVFRPSSVVKKVNTNVNIFVENYEKNYK